MRLVFAILLLGCGVLAQAPAHAYSKDMLKHAEDMAVTPEQMDKLFAGYPAVPLQQPKAELRLFKETDAYEHRARIKKAWREAKTPTFAGRYVWVSASCGDGCRQHFLADWMTGEVIKLDFTDEALYSPDSTLVITQPPWEGEGLALYKMQLGRLIELERPRQ